MQWDKALAIAVVAYLAVALPLYLLNQEAEGECKPVCSAKGFDVVLEARQAGEGGLQCRCFDSLSRAEQWVEAG